VATDQADLQDTYVGVLIADEVHGDVKALVDKEGAILIGVIAGAVFGLVSVLGNLLFKRKQS
jgi:hypothetical protein